jgi:hypothetical protein
MKGIKVCSVIAAVILGTAAPMSQAWHARGHMAVALIAYRQLEQAQQTKIQEILKQHPHYMEFLAASRPNDASLEEWVVMQAAIWPDWVRDHHREFNMPLHHYQDLAVKRLDGATADETQTIENNIAALPNEPANGQLFQELPKRVSEVQDGSTEPKQRAVALCWVLHLVGDIHQPLHAATLFTKDSLKGDRGGNASFVPWQGRAENLHFIWDGVVGWDEFVGIGHSEYRVVDLMARDFQHRHAVTDSERAVAKIEDWAAESRDLAEKHTYSFQDRPIAAVLTFDRHPHLVVANMEPLPDGYPKAAQAVAEKRVALAGYRLANQLKSVLP